VPKKPINKTHGRCLNILPEIPWFGTFAKPKKGDDKTWSKLPGDLPLTYSVRPASLGQGGEDKRQRSWGWVNGRLKTKGGKHTACPKAKSIEL